MGENDVKFAVGKFLSSLIITEVFSFLSIAERRYCCLLFFFRDKSVVVHAFGIVGTFFLREKVAFLKCLKKDVL